MTTVYYVRHGQTENRGQIIYGRMPGFNLSEAGRKEAAAAGKFLATKGVKNIYTSPLERTYQTADVISNQIPNSVITHAFELNEVESSSWQGLNPEELFKNNSYENFINDPDANIGSENLNQLATRMNNFTKLIVEKHKGEAIACISHEIPILSLRLLLENKPLVSVKTYHLSTGSILEIKFDENGKVIELKSVTTA